MKVAGLLGTSLISGVQATTTRLQRAQGLRIVHIATHGFFLQGVGRAEALRQVQRDLRARRSHPHYWASWQLSGDSGALPGDPSAGRCQP